MEVMKLNDFPYFHERSNKAIKCPPIVLIITDIDVILLAPHRLQLQKALTPDCS